MQEFVVFFFEKIPVVRDCSTAFPCAIAAYTLDHYIAFFHLIAFWNGILPDGHSFEAFHTAALLAVEMHVVGAVIMLVI